MCDQLDTCCMGLDSTKVTERKKSVDTLRELVNKPEIIKLLNENERRSWDAVFVAVHRFIKKEGEKLYNDENKQKGSSATFVSRVKSMSHSLLLLVVSKANSGEPRLSIIKILDCVLQCFESHYLRKYFGDVYLTVLVKYALSERKYWGKIDNNKWQDIYNCLKQLHINPLGADKETIYRGLYLTIKYGSLHSSLNLILRKEFDFVKSLCSQLKTNNFSKQEIVLQLLLTFSSQLAKECRMASCKLGEDVSRYLIELYEPRHEVYGGKKSLIFDFFLLQIRLHHPEGVTEGCDAAYAYEWAKWNKILRSLYSILLSEIDVVLREYNISSNNNTLPELWPNFLALFVEVTRQVFHSGTHDVTQASVLAQFTEFSQIAKRPRLETGVPAIISSIQNKDNWPWLSILSELLITYPETIQHVEFITILEILANLQSECNQNITRHYLYKLLNTMVQAQEHLAEEHFDLERMESLWTKIWETTLRSVGLNQNENTTHKQLQLMLLHKKSPHPLALLNIFTSGVLNISTHSIQTLYILCQTITFPEFSPNNPILMIRKCLINFILEINNEKVLNTPVYVEKMTAEVLTGLVIKTWPYRNMKYKNEDDNREYKSIEDSYILSSFEGGLLFEKQITKNKEKQNNYLLHTESYAELRNCVNNFCEHHCKQELNNSAETINLINAIVLVLNLLSSLLEVGLLNEENFQEYLNITELFTCLYKAVDKQKSNIDLQLLKSIEMMLSQTFHLSVAAVVRQKISVEFLKIFFDMTYSDEVDGLDDMDDEPIASSSSTEIKSTTNSSCSLLSEDLLNNNEKTNLAAVRILSHYSCVPGSTIMTQHQKQVLETLSNAEFDANSNIEFQMTVYLLKTLNSCKVGSLATSTIEFVLNALRNMMETKYEDYYAASLLLEILRDAVPHIYSSDGNECKRNTLILLEPFYEKREAFGCAVAVTIADCMGNIVKMDSSCQYEGTKDIITKLVGFLKSDFHEVRLSAIKNILNIFNVTSETTNETLKKQTEMLKEVNKKVLESFTIDGNINQEQRVDETANRTASALHMFSALIVVHPIWRKQTLYFLIQLVADKKLHIDLIKKVLSIVVKYLGVKDEHIFLNIHVNYLITKWNNRGLRICDFPFNLFGCENDVSFFVKYINIVVPVLLQQDGSDILKNVCVEMRKSIKDVLKDCYPSILAQFLPIYVLGKSSEDNKFSIEDLSLSKRLFKQLAEILNCDKDPTIMISKLDQVVVQLLHRFFDCKHFKKQFDFTQILPEPDPPFFSHDVVISTLKYIEKKLPTNNLSVTAYCIKNCPNKLENILLEITTNHYNSVTIEEKLSSFHKYSVLVHCIIQELQSQNQMNTFLFRNITYTLVNVIKLNKDNFELLSIAACRYFKTFCANCLPYCSNIFEKFLILIVNTLVPIIKLDTKLSTECGIVLNFLIVENSKYLYNSIGSLDPFPKDAKFTSIQEVYEKIKYGNDTFTLEQEIRHFLNVGNVLDLYDRIEGLQHLRIQLSVKKSELIELYSNLNKLRGFCDDCSNSILHQLICMLVKLTTSTNAQVRLEAARCLGELGPADLTTLVLKPEETDLEKDSSPLELVAGQIVVLLSQYLVSHESKIAKAASNALYAVLDSREGFIIATNKEKTDYGCGVLEESYIFPYLTTKKKLPETNININETEFCSSLDHPEFWCPTSQCCHSEWITTLVSELLKTFPEKCFLRDLIPVCQVKTEFSEQILPLIIYLVLFQNLKKCTVVISKQIQRFFENHWQGSISNKNSFSQASTDSIVMFNRASVQCMLNVVHFIRLRRSICENKKTIDELQLNYLHVAQGAQFCSAYFTSVLYAELWCYKKLEEKPINSQCTTSTLEHVCENQPSELTLAFENMLREAYKKIGDVDAMHGCGTSYILNTKSRIEYYKNIGRWDKVILHYDTQLGFESQTPSADLANALKNNSLHYLASNVKSEELSTQYECAWRLNQWDFGIKNENRGCDFGKYHFLALKCLHETDLSGMNQAISQATTCVIDNLAHASLESSKSLYGALTELQMLQEVENFAKARSQLTLKDLLEKWQTLGLTKNEFDYVEPIQAQRITMLNDIYLNDNVELVKSFLVDMNLQLADEARTEGFYHVAHRSLNNLSLIEELTPEMKSRMLFEQAQLLWMDDKTSGRYLLKYLIDNNNTLSLDMFGTALRLYGNWMVESRSENPSTIIENYFEKSLEILNDFNNAEKDVENLCQTLDSYARFSDSQYQQVASYISSSSFNSKVQTIQKFRNMAKILKKPSGDKTSDEKKAIALYERQSLIDETEVQNAYKEKDLYLGVAVSNYLRILELCDSYNLKIFRILSLSLENKASKDLLPILKQNLPTIASYKYIPLLPQLVPHIDSNQNDVFEKIIQELLERCATDHPYHTLPIILALAESYKDRNFDATCSSESVETRVQTAKDLITKLKRKKHLTQIISNMEIVSTALISLAYVDASKCTKGRSVCSIPKGETIRSIKNLDNVLVPTINLEVRKSRNYTNITGICEFSSTFAMVGGVNAPKKITCLGTDGIQRTQLVKGKDDLRQDAVMQQVFSIMNTLLAKNKQTSKLLIRTYKVVPLSQRSGVIEWCANTEPLGSYLNDAHKKYHPSDMTPNEARAQLRAVHLKDHNIKYRKYKEVTSKLRPVFHMFFISSYPQPTVWYERRRAYMHSVATSSMVGYILGLGDRHVHNILLDLNTAEVIHIDFGIAFEQGMVLPTPETVPFRLSRDIEAGMGICGIEGVFRRSCEKTMHVLRQNAETVLTILEVLLYDPLYVWTITPAEAYSRQRDDDQQSYNFSDDDPAPVNVTAERALLRLKQKLQGTENGGVCSVEGQVELLLQQARDPVKLSRLFNGWQAYL